MNIKNKILASYSVLFLAIIVMFLLFFDCFKSNTVENNNQFFCGTESLKREFKEGKKLFKSLCASCHKLDKKLVGPALGGLEIDSLSLFKYLISEKHKPSFSQLSLENSNDILNYIK